MLFAGLKLTWTLKLRKRMKTTRWAIVQIGRIGRIGPLRLPMKQTFRTVLVKFRGRRVLRDLESMKDWAGKTQGQTHPARRVHAV